jgi:hypothetical protein
VLHACFDAGSLAAWWHVTQSVTSARALGPYALEWAPTDVRDNVLGRLGGVLYGTVVEASAAAGFSVANIYWLPPEGDPIGPMALDVAFMPIGTDDRTTRVRVHQQGFDEGERWRRYYEVFGPAWQRALASLKNLLEA